MNRYEQAEKQLIDKLRSGDEKLINLAAFAILQGWQKGYCEFTGAPEVYEALKLPSGEQLWCSWCGKLHHDDTREDYIEHQKLSKITDPQWEEARKLSPDTISPVNTAKNAGLI